MQSVIACAVEQRMTDEKQCDGAKHFESTCDDNFHSVSLPVFAQTQPKTASKRVLLVSIPDRKLAVVENGIVKKIYPVAVGKDSSPVGGDWHSAATGGQQYCARTQWDGWSAGEPDKRNLARYVIPRCSSGYTAGGTRRAFRS
jgi:hypothetical protein